MDWQQRYLNQDTPWDLGQVSPVLKSIIDHQKDKTAKVLLPGAGNAYEAVYMIAQGFTDVTVLDIAKQPLIDLQKRCNSPSLQIIHGDFFDHQGHYDLILEQTFFCALPLANRNIEHPNHYPKKMKNLLVPNGLLTGVLFTIDRDRDHPPYGGNIKEYTQLFKPYFNSCTFAPTRLSHHSRKGKEIIFTCHNS